MIRSERLTDRVIDAGFGVIFVVVQAFWVLRLADSWGGLSWLLDVGVATTVAVIALARRRGRAIAAYVGSGVAVVALVIAAVAGLPAEPGPGLTLALAVLTGSAVRRLPGSTAAVAAGAGLVVVAGSLAFQRTGSPTVPPVTVLAGLGWLASVAAGLGLRLQDEHHRAAAEEVRRDERLKLARELHDVVGHHVAGIVLQTQATKIIRHRQPARLDESLDGIEKAGRAALDATRRVVGVLREPDLPAARVPGPGPLEELIERFSGLGAPVRLRLPDDLQDWPPELINTVHRIVQESLTNAVRHAPAAKSIMVEVTRDRRMITVEVVDDGPRSSRTEPGGYGLLGLRERVQALDGTLTAGPRGGVGWAVQATLPLPAGAVR